MDSSPYIFAVTNFVRVLLQSYGIVIRNATRDADTVIPQVLGAHRERR